ncbi:hypothetical protein D3C75_451350 [compost metagenome]
MRVRRVNNVGFDHHILVDEVCRIRVVSNNSAHFRRRQVNLIDARVGEEGIYSRAIQQVQLVAVTQHQFNVCTLLKLTNDGGTDHPAMAGNKDTLFIHAQDSSAMATS